MGTSCIGRSKKSQSKKNENKSNTVSSDLNSHQEVFITKKALLEKQPSIIFPIFAPKEEEGQWRRFHPYKVVEIHRQYRYQQYFAGFTCERELTGKITVGKHEEIRGQAQIRMRKCTQCQKQYWCKRGYRIIVQNLNTFFLSKGQNLQIKKKEALEERIEIIKESQISRIQKKMAPGHMLSLRVTVENNSGSLKIDSVNYKDISEGQLKNLTQQMLEIYSQNGSFTGPYLSGLYFCNSKTEQVPQNIQMIRKLLRIPHYLPRKFHLLLYNNKVSAQISQNQQSQMNINQLRIGSSFIDKKAISEFSKYFEISTIIEGKYGGFWQIQNLKELQQIFPAGSFYGYMSIQFLRCFIDAQQWQFSKESSHNQAQQCQKKLKLIEDFLRVGSSVGRGIAFLTQVYFLMQGYTSLEVEQIVNNLLRATSTELVVIADGLFHEFGVQINEKQHPFRNQQQHFIRKYSQIQFKNQRMILFKKTVITPIQDLSMASLNLLAKLRNNNLKITDIYSIHGEFMTDCSLGIVQIALNQEWRAEKVMQEDMILRLALHQYYLKLVDGIAFFHDWQKVLVKVSSSACLSAQALLVFFTLGGITYSLSRGQKQKTAQEQGFYLKAIEMAHRLFGDPRTFRRQAREPEHFWQLLILQNFISLYRHSPDKKEYHFLLTLFECLREDFGQSYTTVFGEQESGDFGGDDFRKRLRRMGVCLPTRRLSGLWLLRSDVWEADSEDSRSNFSQNGSYSSKKTKKSSYKIQQWEFSARLGSFGGTVRWGSGVSGPPQIWAPLKNIQVLGLASGNYHGVLVSEEGVFGWGQNHSGQLGTHNPARSYAQEIVSIYSVSIDRRRDVFQLSCGNQHTAVLMNEILHMWGQKQCGILGGNGKRFSVVVCGGLHTLGIRDKEIYSWGRGEGGQLGHSIDNLTQRKKQESTEYFVEQPLRIEGLKGVVRVACGDAHSVVLTAQGRVWVFGFCYQGQLGVGLTGDSESFQVFQPVELSAFRGMKVIDVWAGPTFSFFKTDLDQIWSCGLNDCLQLGIDRVLKVFQKKKFLGRSIDLIKKKVGELQFSRPRKVEIFGGEVRLNVVSLQCGQNHCLALVNYREKESLLMGWGYNKHFQVDWQFGQSTTPRTIDCLFGLYVRDICCGATYSMATVGEIIFTQNQLQQILLNRVLDARDGLVFLQGRQLQQM